MKKTSIPNFMTIEKKLKLKSSIKKFTLDSDNFDIFLGTGKRAEELQRVVAKGMPFAERKAFFYYLVDFDKNGNSKKRLISILKDELTNNLSLQERIVKAKAKKKGETKKKKRSKKVVKKSNKFGDIKSVKGGIRVSN